MKTIFSKIIDGEIPSFKVDEDEFCYAFLDIYPVARGHVLVVPKIEVDYFFDLDDVWLERLVGFAKKIARAMDQCLECERIGVTILGLEIPHAHIHLVPLQADGIIDFRAPKLELESAEMKAIAANIAEKIT